MIVGVRVFVGPIGATVSVRVLVGVIGVIVLVEVEVGVKFGVAVLDGCDVIEAMRLWVDVGVLVGVSLMAENNVVVDEILATGVSVLL